MRSALQIGLRAGERIYINGAVLQVDRKVRLELLNNATFLIGTHVMQLDQATTPMRQLYFLIQSLMMDPGVTDSLRPAIDAMIAGSARDANDPARVEVLLHVGCLLSDGSAFEALKAVRGLVQVEDQVSRALAGTQLDLEVA